jgi:beta-aspartyl-peptidase (threonine type)
LFPRIIVHGGAWNIPKELEKPHLMGVKEAILVGWDILMNGGSALEAVEEAVVVMEDNPVFDAGVGSVLNEEGFVELDAIIMDGKSLKAGAVASVRHIRNPIRLAKIILEETNHILIVGDGAEKIAKEHGIKLIDNRELVVERELKRWKILKEKGIDGVIIFGENDFGTVGAVAIDKEGNLAAATSTGGTPNKPLGRVGDSPIIGCGAYADNEFGAVSTTGHGESIMRVLLAKRIIDNLSKGFKPQLAVEEALNYMLKRVNGKGGAIVIDKNGDVGLYHTTPKMAFAYIKNGKVVNGIKI